uniref:CCHC-type domain-containing protein n=1 Tax=Tanacetum cinerariifolium TaxID=118510 RepID=A0A699IIE1_TANCI|nr:hypothetical protein [Tanacetum cinerariifolium]
MELVLEQTQQGTSHEVSEYIKKDVEVPGSSRLTRFIAICSYSTDIHKDIKKAQVLVSPAVPAAPALLSMPIDLLPPYKRFGSMERIDTLEREVESLIARLIEEHQGHLAHKIDRSYPCSYVVVYQASGGNSNGNGNGNGNGYDNGNGSHSDKGSGCRRTVHTTQGCTYKEFLNCQPLTLRALKELWDYPDELALLCQNMVLDEEEKVKRYIYGLPNSIKGNVTSAGSLRLQDTIKLANSLMIKEFVFMQQGRLRTREGWRTIQETTICSNHLMKGITYQGPTLLALFGHQTKDCRSPAATNIQRTPVANQWTLNCFECGKHGHYRSECPKLKNKNHRNAAGNGEA